METCSKWLTLGANYLRSRLSVLRGKFWMQLNFWEKIKLFMQTCVFQTWYLTKKWTSKSVTLVKLFSWSMLKIVKCLWEENLNAWHPRWLKNKDIHLKLTFGLLVSWSSHSYLAKIHLKICYIWKRELVVLTGFGHYQRIEIVRRRLMIWYWSFWFYNHSEELNLMKLYSTPFSLKVQFLILSHNRA